MNALGRRKDRAYAYARAKFTTGTKAFHIAAEAFLEGARVEVMTIRLARQKGEVRKAKERRKSREDDSKGVKQE